jgi:putative ABC transport system substrate-binding protein
MRELGYIEGTNLTIDWRFADGEYDRLPALAHQLVQSKIDVSYRRFDARSQGRACGDQDDSYRDDLGR